jgi:5-methylcytosine-specific restriction endonuclease McrA
MAERRSCPGCGEEYGRDSTTGRWSGLCETCKRGRASRVQREQDARRRQIDPDFGKRKSRAWYEANKQRHHADMARYRAEHPEVAVTARAKRRGARIVDTDISVPALGKRCRWICALCGTQVDKTRAYPDPYSPTVDHVLDISAGGEHSWANVQLAHKVCNDRKRELYGAAVVTAD